MTFCKLKHWTLELVIVENIVLPCKMYLVVRLRLLTHVIEMNFCVEVQHILHHHLLLITCHAEFWCKFVWWPSAVYFFREPWCTFEGLSFQEWSMFFFIPCVDILLLQVFHALIQMNYILGKKLSNVMYVRGLCMIELIWLPLFSVQLRIYFLHLDLEVALVESLHMYRRNIWY